MTNLQKAQEELKKEKEQCRINNIKRYIIRKQELETEIASVNKKIKEWENKEITKEDLNLDGENNIRIGGWRIFE